MPKTQVNYRKADSRAESCGVCAHGQFAGTQTSGACEVVGGKIDSRMVSDRFEKKAEEKDDG